MRERNVSLPAIDEVKENEMHYELSDNNYEFSPQVWIHSARGDSAAKSSVLSSAATS